MADQTVKISVRNMVELVLRSGSIDSSFMSAKRAQEGTRIHQHTQRLRQKQALLNDEIYEKEFSLVHSFVYQGFQFQVEGRADGVWFKKDASIAIEEIKSTTTPLEHIENNTNLWHWAQAKCYAYLYCVLNAVQDICVQLTYVSVESGEEKVFECSLTFSEVETFFFDIVQRYYLFAKMDFDRIAERNETGKNLQFPYEAYRKSQRELAVAVYKTTQQNKKLFASAPTGTGKTISTLFPSIKALTEGLGEKIFYATAKTITRQVAEDALTLMKNNGLVMRSITLTAKDKICFCKEAACNPTECHFANGHFDRINAAIFDVIANESTIDRQTVERYAKAHTVCPFEFSFDITLFVDCIICDYNYIYDPKVRLKRFFGDEAKGDFIVLHDEAHNLVERSRDMFSAQLESTQIAAVGKACRGQNAAVTRTLSKLKTWFDDLNTETGVSISAEPPLPLQPLLFRFAEKTEKWLAETKGEVDDALLELYFKAKDFLKIWEFFDQRYVFYTEVTAKQTTVKLLCLDPSYLLNLAQAQMKSAIFFSATLTPMAYFKDVLGANPNDFSLELPSPFPQKNLCLLVDHTISTMYKDRPSSYEPIAYRLYDMISAKKGNYLAFFSSYEYMKQVQDNFMTLFPDEPVLTQTQHMSEEEREIFLLNFSHGQRDRLLGFAVLGGIFSEGIDLVGDQLLGAAIIGVGLPMITPERNVMMDYYKANGLNGFDFAYVFPGINKVMQAAGRVIRSPQDKGVVLLIDSRFAHSATKAMFPPEWSHLVRLGGSKPIDKLLNAFWLC